MNKTPLFREILEKPACIIHSIYIRMKYGMHFQNEIRDSVSEKCDLRLVIMVLHRVSGKTSTLKFLLKWGWCDGAG